MIGNHTYIIGGAIVGSPEKWKEFYSLVTECQKETLRNNIVDDDQGIFVMCYYKRPDSLMLNYLGRGKWFDLFRVYRRTALGAKLRALRIFLTESSGLNEIEGLPNQIECCKGILLLLLLFFYDFL